MKNREAERYQEYLRILKKTPGLRDSILKSIERYNEQVHTEMLSDTRLYLLTFVPALVAFTEWVLEKAEREKKTRLYFLSRDGYQMYEIARKLVESRQLAIECKYLYVSRYSMRIPTYHMDVERAIESICVGGIDVTPFKILRRGALSQDECYQVLEEMHLEEVKDHILNYQEVLELRSHLQKSELLRRFLEIHSKEVYADARDYLIQEGLCEDDRYFIVDSGWVGTLQESIEIMVRSVNPGIQVKGCYFGMYEVPKQMGKNKFSGYYFDAISGVQRKAHFSNSLFETIVSKDEGMTVGYQRQGEVIEPRIGKLENPNGGMMHRNADALRIFLDLYTEEKEREHIERSVIEGLFFLFMSEPTMVEVRAYGDNRFSDDVIEDGYQKVAAELSVQDIRNQHFINKLCIVKGIKKAVIHESAWLEGSVARRFENQPRRMRIEYGHIRFYKWVIFARKQIRN